MESQVLYSRYSDGAVPIHILTSQSGRRLFSVAEEEGKPKTFSSARKLLIDLTGHPTGRNWTFDRYFKLGRHQSPIVVVGNPVLDLFGPETVLDTLDDDPDTCIQTSTGLTISEVSGGLVPGTASETSTSKLSDVEVSDGVVLGIDLVNRSHEVAKLFYAGFGQRVMAAGYEPDDVLQEIYKGLLTRNKGKCPWDIRKSSFGHYVHMVCGCIVANYHRRQRRRLDHESVGVRAWVDGDLENVDVSSSRARLPRSMDPGELMAEEIAFRDLLSYLEGSSDGRTPDGRLALKVLPLLRAGMTRTEISVKVGVSKTVVSRVMAFLRSVALSWSSH